MLEMTAMSQTNMEDGLRRQSNPTLINGLPEGTIDGVIQGHRHKFAHHFLRGIYDSI